MSWLNPFGREQTFGGQRIHVSPEAIEVAPRFPDKRNTKRRRRRVIGKYGSWTVTKPCAYQVGAVLVVHPRIYQALKRRHAADAREVPL